MRAFCIFQVLLSRHLSNIGDYQLEGIEEVKNWAMGLIFGPAMALLIWYFKRANDRSDKRLDDIEEDIEKAREDIHGKLDREELRPVWEKISLQDNDIKNLGAVFSQELRDQINNLRRESNDHQKQTNERLDRLFMVLTSKGKDQ